MNGQKTEIVVQLRAEVPLAEQLRIGLESLATIIDNLETLADKVQPGSRSIDLLDHAECRLALLRMRLKMRKGLVHLAGEMGRAP
jgi:hypothetical protein